MLISGKWKVLILPGSADGNQAIWGTEKICRPCDTKGAYRPAAADGASGLVNRKVYAEVPPRVEYTLTELGYSLKPILDAMWSWGAGYQQQYGASEPAGET